MMVDFESCVRCHLQNKGKRASSVEKAAKLAEKKAARAARKSKDTAAVAASKPMTDAVTASATPTTEPSAVADTSGEPATHEPEANVDPDADTDAAAPTDEPTADVDAAPTQDAGSAGTTDESDTADTVTAHPESPTSESASGSVADDAPPVIDSPVPKESTPAKTKVRAKASYLHTAVPSQELVLPWKMFWCAAYLCWPAMPTYLLYWGALCEPTPFL